MNLQYFPNFLKINYSFIEASPEEMNEIGVEFKKYLEEKFKGDMKKLEPIWAIDPKDVIPKIGHPFFTNGYSPALIIHFGNFCKEVAEKQ